MENNFVENFDISDNQKYLYSPLKNETLKGQVKVYYSMNQMIHQKFDLYLIDGPYGSNKYSRYDAFKIAENLTRDDNFILLIDDYDREGEKDTVNLDH